jgi:hypothetical protein
MRRLVSRQKLTKRSAAKKRPIRAGRPQTAMLLGVRLVGWTLRFQLAAVLVLSAFLGGSLSARSDGFPKLNVAPLCHGITDKSTLQLGFQTVTFDECMKAEQEDRQTMIKEWSTFSSSGKRLCIAEATTGGVSSYTELVSCLEMVRDVKHLGK